ncbi:MAG: iron-siderophore ABC transporter substrate-binding protein [Goleter apudmare HA4340-LM2]|jgi:iron complex transport system substrate-binding protein|nr:iron-siderophore ABC transporter substrate-binding protein [Goleter apudmare HA4340-LM2]
MKFGKILLLITFTFIIITACSNYLPPKNTISSSNLDIYKCKVVKHNLGESCIPLQPQRIIALDEIMMEILLALDLKPVAAPEPTLAGSKRLKFGEKAGNIANLGKESHLNLEKIVSLNPDLILGFSFGIEQNYKLLSHIAPTVGVDYVQAGWKDALLSVAEIIGKSQKARKLLDEYQQKIAVFRQKISHQKTVTVIRFYSGNITPEFRNKFSFPVSIITEVGLSMPKKQNPLTSHGESPYVSVSLERVDLLDADILFAALDPKSEDSFQKYQNSPLWQQLNVVRNNRVYTVDSSYWIFGNILSANAILDDLFTHLVKAP